VAAEIGCSTKTLIECIVIAKSPQQNLSSAIRCYVCAYFCGASPRHALIDPTSKLAVRVAPEGKINFNGERSRRRAEGLLEEMRLGYGTRKPRSRQRGDGARPPRPRAA
jgi:hypothetical protein